jgi:4-amino-4-deoxy-L-arabinose transferase-like glycosyltransferase
MLGVVALLARLKALVEPRIDLIISVLLALAAFAVYVRTLTPGVLDGDSGEWQYMANILGVPHSTGYPLYILLAKLVTFLPFGDPAWRVNLFSAICAAFSSPVVYLLAKRVGRSRIAGILSASFFAFMPTLWASATIAEVYALNTLLIALTLFFAVRFFDHGHMLDASLMALCIGLALTNHRIAFFMCPALLLVIWLKRSLLGLRRFSLVALAFVLPLALYLYIPLRASQLLAEQSPENWELYPRAEAIVDGRVTAYYNHTPAGFINLVTALDNRNKLGFENADGQDQTLARLENAWHLLREQIDPFGIALAALGIIILFRRERVLAVLLLWAGLPIAAVSIVLRAESTRFYFSGAYLVMVLFFATAVG